MNRRRKMAMAAGVATTASLLFGQQAAGAAEFTAEDGGSVTYDDGTTVECSVELFTRYNNDDSENPTLFWSMARQGASACDHLSTDTTATYNDSQDTQRRTRAQAESLSWGEVDGAFPTTTVTTTVTFWNCVQDGRTAEECSVTLTASPK